ncbi:MAG: SDR family oxidoreductase [Steroidobacteraceae bacterium]
MSPEIMSLDGQRIVIIGGSSGIGFAVAALGCELGAKVVIASRNKERVDAAVTRLNGTSGAAADLRDEAGVSRFFEHIGDFEHLVITANDWSGKPAPAPDMDLAAAHDAFEVRFWGALAAIQQGSRRIATNGTITLTSGMLAHRPKKGAALTTIVAGAIEHLARALAIDLAPIRVNAVCPGLTLTEHSRQMPELARQAFVAGLPLQRGASPEEAATAYVYAMLNGYVTGQIIPVDGGGSLV